MKRLFVEEDIMKPLTNEGNDLFMEVNRALEPIFNKYAEMGCCWRDIEHVVNIAAADTARDYEMALFIEKSKELLEEQMSCTYDGKGHCVINEPHMKDVPNVDLCCADCGFSKESDYYREPEGEKNGGEDKV